MKPQTLRDICMLSPEFNFDVAGIKIQSYSKVEVQNARAGFARLLNSALSEIDQTKHLKVTQAVEKLDADTLDLMAQQAKSDHFSIGCPRTTGDVMGQMASGVKDAVRHLLSLSIVRFDADVSARTYAYHWTEFGKAVLMRLGL